MKERNYRYIHIFGKESCEVLLNRNINAPDVFCGGVYLKNAFTGEVEWYRAPIRDCKYGSYDPYSRDAYGLQ